jgi:hypothetical protein
LRILFCAANDPRPVLRPRRTIQSRVGDIPPRSRCRVSENVWSGKASRAEKTEVVEPLGLQVRIEEAEGVTKCVAIYEFMTPSGDSMIGSGMKAQ